jgi:ABC-type lipoprotein export system ATPase subunit
VQVPSGFSRPAAGTGGGSRLASDGDGGRHAEEDRVIKLSNVEKCYESRAGKTWVLRRITTEIRAGEFVTIMGPSGAGKSTLLAILGMLDGEWQGEYGFLGQEVHRLSNRDRLALHKQYFGFVFQQYHLIDDLTVAENLDLPLSYRDVPRAQRQTMVADSLDRFQIVAKKDLFPSQLSGGQQQLVAVARAVAGNPRVILADEPVGSLHTDQGRMIMELLARLNREGVTVVQVTHSQEWAAFGSRVIRLRDGWLDEPAPPPDAAAR